MTLSLRIAAHYFFSFITDCLAVLVKQQMLGFIDILLPRESVTIYPFSIFLSVLN